MKKNNNQISVIGPLVAFLAVIFLLTIPFILTGIRSCSAEKKPEYTATSEALRVDCVDGYKFVVYLGGFGGGVSQMLILDEKGSLVPAMCVKNSTP